MKKYLIIPFLLLFSVLQGKSIQTPNFKSSSSINNKIVFQKGETAFIVFEATTPLEKRVIAFLRNYMEEVL
jgi:hypothetical protein